MHPEKVILAAMKMQQAFGIMTPAPIPEMNHTLAQEAVYRPALFLKPEAQVLVLAVEE